MKRPTSKRENEMNSNINVTHKSITMNNQIDGVEIEANFDELKNEWVCNDGFNTYRCEDQAEAVAWIEEALDFYVD